jgi:hypothetical protein
MPTRKGACLKASILKSVFSSPCLCVSVCVNASVRISVRAGVHTGVVTNMHANFVACNVRFQASLLGNLVLSVGALKSLHASACANVLAYMWFLCERALVLMIVSAIVPAIMHECIQECVEKSIRARF